MSTASELRYSAKNLRNTAGLARDIGASMVAKCGSLESGATELSRLADEIECDVTAERRHEIEVRADEIIKSAEPKRWALLPCY